MATTARRRAPARKSIRKAKRKIDERITGRDDHGTPGWLIDLITKYQRIGLDPAGGDPAFPASKAAHRVYRVEKGDDGLRDPWRGFGLVFCNPEYGTIVRKWMRKAVAEFGDLSVEYGVDPHKQDELIMLVAARVDTRWFRLGWQRASALLLFETRIEFIGEEHGAKFPSAIQYFGRRPEAFARHFGHLGTVLYAVGDGVIEGAAVAKRGIVIQFPPELTRAERKAAKALR